MKNTKLFLRAGLMVILLTGGFLLTSCSDDIQGGTEKTVYIVDYNYFDNEIKTFEGLDIDGFTYIKTADYIELATYMNNFIKLYKPFTEEIFNYEDEVIALEYVENVEIGEDLSLGYTLPSFETVNVTNTGLTTMYISNDQLPWKKYKGEVYLPLDVLRHQIFFRNAHLVKQSSDKYYWMGRSVQGATFQERDQELRFDFEEREIDYNKALTLLEIYTGLDFADEIVGTSYGNYVLELYRTYWATDDYHFSLMRLKDYDDQKYRDQVIALYNEVGKEHPLTAEGKSDYDDMYFENLNDHTSYLDIHHFGDGNKSFRQVFKAFITSIEENPEITDVVIDLRYNPGGRLDYSHMILDKFINDGFTFKYGYQCGDELCIRGYELEKEEAKKLSKDYNITVLSNEYCASASLRTMYFLQQYAGATILGGEPADKKGQPIIPYQLPDNTMITRTDPFYYLVNDDGIPLDNVDYVDTQMTQEEMEAFLADLRNE